jgi:hypothetical protein
MCVDYLNVLVLLSKEAKRMSATYRSELMYVKILVLLLVK